MATPCVAAFKLLQENGLSWAMPMRATIFQKRTASLKNFSKALNWSLVVACRAEGEKFNPAPCRSHTAGSGTLSFREWTDICLRLPFMMSIATSADLHEKCIIDWNFSAREWNLPPR